MAELETKVVGWDVDKIGEAEELALQIHGQLEEIYEIYGTILEKLKAAWQGEAANTHISHMEETDYADLSALVNDFKEFARVLGECKTLYTNATSDIVSAVEEAERSVGSCGEATVLQPIPYVQPTLG